MDPYETPSLIEDLEKAAAAVKAALPRIIEKHRSSGILTWSLLHQIEREVLEDVANEGRHKPRTLNMLRSIPAMGYPTDDRPVSFKGHEAISSAFAMIHDAWQRVH